MSENIDRDLEEIKRLINSEYPATSTKSQQPQVSRTPKQTQNCQKVPQTKKQPKPAVRQRNKIDLRRYCIIGGAVVMLLLIIILAFKGCAGGDALQGTWDMDGTTIYQFHGNGEGAMILPSNTFTFKYTINKDNKTVSIDFDDERASDYTYDYEVTKDKLVLSGSVGKESFAFEFARITDK